MTATPKALLFCGIIAGSLSTVAFGLARSAPGQTIFACVNRHGALRIAASEACRRGETSLSWNRQGPAGPPGKPGPAGPPKAEAGILVSPNGEFVVSVDDDGIILAGAGSTIALSADGIILDSPADLLLESSSDVAIDADNRVTIQANGEIRLQAAVISQN